MILDNCHHIRPFVPEQIDGKPGQSFETKQIANDLRFFHFVPGERWHGFEGYAEHQYFVDPCKLLLTTPGIDANGDTTPSVYPRPFWRTSCVSMAWPRKNAT
ncbi:hypothetical protein ACLK2H_04050 [Escherichia coli]